MGNPNNCKTCEYRKYPGAKGGHCHMFKSAPEAQCMKHTERMKLGTIAHVSSQYGDLSMQLLILKKLLQGMQGKQSKNVTKGRKK
jgi:hypothetical protein